MSNPTDELIDGLIIFLRHQDSLRKLENYLSNVTSGEAGSVARFLEAMADPSMVPMVPMLEELVFSGISGGSADAALDFLQFLGLSSSSIRQVYITILRCCIDLARRNVNGSIDDVMWLD
jgi:hypothetical protein